MTTNFLAWSATQPLIYTSQDFHIDAIIDEMLRCSREANANSIDDEARLRIAANLRNVAQHVGVIVREEAPYVPVIEWPDQVIAPEGLRRHAIAVIYWVTAFVMDQADMYMLEGVLDELHRISQIVFNKSLKELCEAPTTEKE
jgi:hypothetical protein